MSNEITEKEHDMSAKRVHDYDLDKDGQVSEQELNNQLTLEKATAQRNIAALAFLACVIVMFFLLTPYTPLDRIETLSSIIEIFFIAMASVVGAFFGFTAWMSKK